MFGILKPVEASAFSCKRSLGLNTSPIFPVRLLLLILDDVNGNLKNVVSKLAVVRPVL